MGLAPPEGPTICDICKENKTGSICSYTRHEDQPRYMCVECYMARKIDTWPEYWKVVPKHPDPMDEQAKSQ